MALIPALLPFCAASSVAWQRDVGPPQRGGWDQRGRDGRGWDTHDKRRTLERLAKTLAGHAKVPGSCPETIFLQARATDLLERTRQAQANDFQFDRLARATDALLRAMERIDESRKTDWAEEEGRRQAAEFLQRCYFRAQQAEYFGGTSGEKEARQYIVYARSLYQQARSAYDARLYAKAQMLGDASSLIVAALENIAHASLKIADPPIIK
jgi:hypothetical protein